MGRNGISPARQGIFYIGRIIGVIGLLLFLSVFFTFAMHLGDFSNFEERGRSMMLRAVSGMIFMVIGMFMSTAGRFGAAGSGIVLDPEQMREDLKPWNEAAGEMTNDVISKVDVVNKIADGLSGMHGEVVKVRCRECKALNDEAARFCSQCGKAL